MEIELSVVPFSVKFNVTPVVPLAPIVTLLVRAEDKSIAKIVELIPAMPKIFVAFVTDPNCAIEVAPGIPLGDQLPAVFQEVLDGLFHKLTVCAFAKSAARKTDARASRRRFITAAG